MPKNDRTASVRRNGVLLLAFCAMVGSGCAQDRTRGRFPRAGQDSSTIATDRRTIPRGETIPPAGLGVDLVQSPSRESTSRATKSRESKSRGDATLTSFSRLGVPDTARR